MITSPVAPPPAPAVTNAAPLSSAERLAGDWVLHIYVGQRLFDDQVHLDRDAQGAWEGHLTVPGLFTAPIDRVRIEGDVVSFQIEADEGRGPFRVEYAGRLHPTDDVLAGFATVDGTSLLGGFVAQRTAPAE